MKISNLMVREFVLSIIEEESITTAEELADHLLLRKDDIIFRDEEFINFDRSELDAIKDNILHTKMHGHKLTETEKLILAKVEAAISESEVAE